jgi:RNA polymerase sigma-70 factor (ECF subfamily)
VRDASVTVKPGAEALEQELEQHRVELTGYCYRMLGSAFDADDAVQETFLRAWRGFDRFEGRAAVRSWLYRIATNVCLVVPDGDPAEVAAARETVRLAFVAALQHLPPRQRAVLLLCEVLRWEASEVAELLKTSVASVNSALQRARATLDARNATSTDTPPAVDDADSDLLSRYVKAFEDYDMDALTSLIHEDATQSMPPYDMWLRGRDHIFAWWVGPGIACRGSRVIPTLAANGAPAFGQYKPAAGGGYEPWALQVLEISDGRIVELTFFLDTDTLFPLFGLPPRLDA